MKIRLLTLLLPLTALAAVQGPDAGGYSATDAAVFSFVDISGGGGRSVSNLIFIVLYQEVCFRV